MTYNPDYHRAYYLKNREKKKAQARAWKKQNPDKARSYRKNERDLRFKRVFGISLVDYENMLLKQKGVCKICGGVNYNKHLAVDHCHKTKKVRGLLCSKCNQGLGLFNDDVDLLVAAKEYVQRNNSN